MASESAERAARLMDAEVRRIEHAGIRSGNAAAIKLRSDVLRAWLRGGDPEAPIAAWQKATERVLADAMAAGYLQGRLRARAVFRRAERSLTMAQTIAGVMDDFGDRLGLPESSVKQLARYFSQSATSMVVDAGGFVRSKIADAAQKAVDQGLNVRSGAALIREAMDASGVTTQNPYLAQTLYRTSLQETYAAARWQANQDPAVQDILWGYEFAATLDDRTTELCADLDGTRRPKADPFWNRYTPPNHWNAIGRGVPVRTMRGDLPIEDVQVGDLVWTHRGRWRRVYATMAKRADTPTMRQLFLSTGGILFVTDEHPVLTSTDAHAGFVWKRADDLQVGDVLCEYSEQVSGPDEVLLSDPNDCPPVFDEESVAFDIVRMTHPAGVVLSIDFKGDHGSRECEVDVVPADGVLKGVFGFAESEQVQHQLLTIGWLVAPCTPPAFSHLLDNARHTSGVVFSHSFGSIGAGLAPTPVVLAAFSGDDGGVAVCDPALVLFGSDGDAMPLAEPVERSFASPERCVDSADRLAFAPVAIRDEGASLIDRQWKWIHAFIICTAEVSSTETFHNLAVEDDETYLAGGVIVHNCRSQVIEIFTGDDEAAATAVPQVPLPQDGFQVNFGELFTAAPQMAAFV